MTEYVDPNGKRLTARQRDALTRKDAAFRLFNAKVAEFCSYSNVQSINGMSDSRQGCHDTLDALLDAYDACAKADRQAGVL